MKANIKSYERILRIIVALLLCGFYFTDFFNETWRVLFLLGGIIIGLSGVLGYCAFYQIMGINKPGSDKTNN